MALLQPGCLDQIARHQRRILIPAETLLAHGADSALISSCLHWQDEYIGGLYVSVPGQSSAEAVHVLLTWGLSGHSVVFFERQAVAGIAQLRAAMGIDEGDPARACAAAEVLAVGATDVVTPDPGVLSCCIDIARTINRRLGAMELPVPAEISAQAKHQPGTELSSARGNVCHSPVIPGPGQVADLLAEGRRRISRDCEQVLDLLDKSRRAGQSSRRGRTGRRSSSTIGPVVRATLAFNVADYVAAARAGGRGQLDPALRQRMAYLYEDLRLLLLGEVTECCRSELRQLRLAQLVFQNEWKLSAAAQAGPFHTFRDLVPEFPGRRNLPYAQMRLLNDVVGARRHTSDLTVDGQCWDAARYLTTSWIAHEREAVAGSARWCCADMPGTSDLQERIRRLRTIQVAGGGTGPNLRAAAQPPRSWEGYLGRNGRANVLEYLVTLPFSRRHDEGTFLRTIHLTEIATWGILCWVMSANEWCKDGNLARAATCLDRAVPFAQLQVDVLQMLRRTMSVDRFQAFRGDTGESSAVQSLGSQLLSIHLFGVHPAKVDALRQVPENEFLLLYRNHRFESLWRILQRIPADAPGAPLVVNAARRLDSTLFKWRRLHLGLAYRYLPDQTTGTGGTAGSAYLERFYLQRLFDTEGQLQPLPSATMPAIAPSWMRGRPVRSPLN